MEFPAIVVTLPFVILRITLFPESAIYIFLFASIAIPTGLKNLAEFPVPSNKLPLFGGGIGSGLIPAKVETKLPYVGVTIDNPLLY